MTLFGNSAFNRVYLHGAIQAFAELGGGAFLSVTLLKQGVPVPLVLCSMAAINAARFFLRAGVLPLARRIGLRNTLIVGTLFESTTYWLVPHVAGPGSMLLVLIALASVGSVIYWTSYHAYVAVAGDAANRGSQIGMVEALSAVVSVVAPALMAALLLSGGPTFAFGAIAIVQMLAALPLVGAPRILVPAVVGDDLRARRFGMRLFFADGWAFGCMHLLWQIALFVTLGEQIAAYGGTMVLAGLFGAGMSLTFGHLIDLGHGKHSAAIAYGGAAIAASAMLLSYATPVAAVAATALGAIVGAIQRPTMLACIYNVAQRSSCPLRFHMASEAGWDLGSAASCLTSAALIWFGAPIGAPIALAFAGLGVSCFMLRSSYVEQARLGHVQTS